MLKRFVPMSFPGATDGEILFEDFEAIQEWESYNSGAYIGVEGTKAIQIDAPGWIQRQYAIDATERRSWDRSNGIAFKVKGDGSEHFGCITIGGQNLWLYSYYFPLDSKEWKEYSVHWDDFVPGSDFITGKFNTPGNLTVGGISMLRIGDRWNSGVNNRTLSAFSYQVANIRLIESAVPRFTAKPPEIPPHSHFSEKLAGGKPVKIYCYGDSLTAGTSLENPDTERYAIQLQEMLRQRFHRQNIEVRSFGVGGAHLFDVLGWMPRDLPDVPDLVTLMIGYNNKSSTQPPETFRSQLELWLERIAIQTGGKTNILLIPTLPGCDYRFHMQDDYAQVVRNVAQKWNVPCCPVDTAFKSLGSSKIADFMTDIAHPNAAGHRLFAETMTAFLTGK